MFSSITSQVEVSARVLLVVGLCGCATTPPAQRCAVASTPPQPTPPPANECQRDVSPVSRIPSTEGSHKAARFLRITLFDCSKAEDIEEGAQPADSSRISKWMAGGPGGAAWNATDLLCFAEVNTACEQGELSSILRVGQRRVAEQKTAIAHAGPQPIQLSAPERVWKSGLDPAAPARSRPFRTAVFSLLTEVSCSKPLEVSPGDATFDDSADSSAFVAGFASGE